MKVDGDPGFLKWRMLSCEQQEGALKGIYKMEQESVISRDSSPIRAAPIVLTMKSERETPRIYGNYQMTLNKWLLGSATTTMEPENFPKCMHSNRYFSKLHLMKTHFHECHYHHNPSPECIY